MMHALSLLVLVAPLGHPAAQEPTTVPVFVVEEAARPETISLVDLAAGVVAMAQRPAVVPGPVLLAAEGSPETFQRALLAVSIPCGVEMRESDRRGPMEHSDRPEPPGDTLLTDVLARFEAHNPDYTARLAGSVVVIRPRRGRVPFLDQPSAIRTPRTVIDMMVAVRIVFTPLNPDLYREGAVIVGSGPFVGNDAEILLDGLAETNLEALNKIVVQTDSIGWIVYTRQHEDRVLIVRAGVRNARGDGRRVAVER